MIQQRTFTHGTVKPAYIRIHTDLDAFSSFRHVHVNIVRTCLQIKLVSIWDISVRIVLTTVRSPAEENDFFL
jgi:hypothetical protein